MIQAAAPQLPPVVASSSSTSSTSVAAVLDSVDNPSNPAFAALIIGDQFPAQSGFVWNTAWNVTVSEAPNPAAAPPANTVYYNNTTTHTGGTIVYVDMNSRTIISITGNYSTIAPVNYSDLFQFIHHNGAFDSTHGFQNPAPVDLNSETSGTLNRGSFAANPNPTQAPQLVGATPSILAEIGAGIGGSYDAKAGFDVDVTGNPAWLEGVLIYVQAHSGTPAATISDPTTMIYKALLPPNSGGAYEGWAHGLSAGTSYDVYAAYLDMQDNVSPAQFLVTTSPNPLTFNATNAAAMPPGTTPSVTSFGDPIVLNDGANFAGFDYIVPDVVLDSNALSSNPWIAEIQLVRRVTGSGAGPSVVNTIDPQATDSFELIFPNNPYGTNSDGSAVSYDLGIQYVDYADNTSNTLYFLTAGGNLQVGSLTLQQIPTGTEFFVTGQSENTLTNTGGATFYAEMGFDLEITVPSGAAPPSQWLDKIYLLAKEQPSGTADSDTVPTDYARVGWIPGGEYGGFSGDVTSMLATFGPMGNNSIWQLAIQLCDHSGTTSSALPIYLVGLQTVDPTKTPQGQNMIPDSDMVFTTAYAGGAIGSTYWTYAGLDPTHFAVVSGTQTSKQLEVDSHAGGAVGQKCAYTQSIPVISGTSYTLSCKTDLYAPTGGAQAIGIVNVSDKTANNTAPASAYAYVLCPVNDHGTPNPGLTQVPWTATFTGDIVCALWANGVTGDCSWFQPQFEVGTSATAYNSGIAVDTTTGTISHAAQSVAVQSVIDASGGLNVASANPTYGTLPHDVNSQEVQDVVGSNGSGRGILNVSPTGGTTGSLPVDANTPAVLGLQNPNLVLNSNFILPQSAPPYVSSWTIDPLSGWVTTGLGGDYAGLGSVGAYLEGNGSSGAYQNIAVKPNTTYSYAGVFYDPGTNASGTYIELLINDKPNYAGSWINQASSAIPGTVPEFYTNAGGGVINPGWTSTIKDGWLFICGSFTTPSDCTEVTYYIGGNFQSGSSNFFYSIGHMLWEGNKWQDYVAAEIYNNGTSSMPHGNMSTQVVGIIAADGSIPKSGPLNAQFSILAIPDTSVLSASSTSTSVTFTWGNIVVYFPDGSTYTIPAGSFDYGGLESGVLQWWLLYYDTNTASMAIYNVGQNTSQAQPSISIIVAANADGCIAITNGWLVSTTGGGTGSTGSPPRNTCPSVNQLIRTKEHGYIRASEAEVGMHLYCTPKKRWVEIQRKNIIDGMICKIKLGSEEFEVDMNHKVLRFEGDPHPQSGDWLPVYELTRNTLIQGLDDVPIPVRSIGEDYYGQYVELTVDGCVYDLGSSVVHNIWTGAS